MTSSNRKKLTNRIMISVALVLLFFVLILMHKEAHKTVVYLVTFLSNITILYCLKNKYIDIRVLGLGKTRKSMHRQIKMDYLRMVLISFVFTIFICLIDLLIYGSVLLYNKVIYLYLLSLSLFTIPMNYIVNMNQSHIVKIMFGTLNLLCLGLSFFFYEKDSLYYFAYMILGIQIIALFFLRNRGFLKKDL